MKHGVQAGTCRYCGCHGDSCRLPDGGLCGWTSMLRTCCTGNRCLRALAESLRKHKRELLDLRRRATHAKWPSQIRRERKQRDRERKTKRPAA